MAVAIASLACGLLTSAEVEPALALLKTIADAQQKLVAANAELQRENAELKSTLTHTTSLLAQAQQEVDTWKARQSQFEKAIADTHVLIRQKAECDAAFLDSTKKLEKQLQQAQELLSAQQALACGAQERCAALDAELSALNTQANQLQKDKDALATQAKAAEASSQQAVARAQALQVQLDEATLRHHATAEQLQNALGAADAAKKAHESLLRKHNQLLAAIAESQRRREQHPGAGASSRGSAAAAARQQPVAQQLQDVGLAVGSGRAGSQQLQQAAVAAAVGMRGTGPGAHTGPKPQVPTAAPGGKAAGAQVAPAVPVIRAPPLQQQRGGAGSYVPTAAATTAGKKGSVGYAVMPSTTTTAGSSKGQPARATGKAVVAVGAPSHVAGAWDGGDDGTGGIPLDPLEDSPPQQKKPRRRYVQN